MRHQAKAGALLTGAEYEAADAHYELVSTVAASGTTETLDVAAGTVHDVTLTDNCTFTFSGGTSGHGDSFTLLLRQDGTGGRTATWPGSVAWPNSVAPTLATAAGAVDILTFLTVDGGTTWYGSYAPATSTNVARIVRKASNETVTGSTTLQNDDDLLLALLANEVYYFELTLWITSGATPDFKCAFTVPASATVEWGAQGSFNNAATTWSSSAVTGSGTSRDFIMGAGTRFLHITGYVANSTNAGNLQLQWAQNTSDASNTIVLANSVLKAWKLA